LANIRFSGKIAEHQLTNLTDTYSKILTIQRIDKVKNFLSTNVLSLLTKRKLLRSRLQSAGFDEGVLEFLTELHKQSILPAESIHQNLPVKRLQKYGLVRIEDIEEHSIAKQKAIIRKDRFALTFVQAVSFELTYQCDMECPHCLQRNIRQDRTSNEMDAAQVHEAIYEAWISGLPGLGINLTGGEALGKYDGIFDLIRYAHSLGLLVRLNSNSWWGQMKDFKIDNQHFSTASDLVGYLKECGLTELAFSFDERFDYNREAFGRLAGSVKACDKNSFLYEIVCTGRTPQQIEGLLSDLRLALNTNFSNLFRILNMSMTYMGGAADRNAGVGGFERELNALAEQVECQLRGFYRPYFLHIDPFGGVRTCLYAPGLSNLGDISRSNFFQIINHFPSDPVSSAFKKNIIDTLCEQLFIPFLHLYKRIGDPCTACVLLARLIEGASDFEIKYGRKAEEKEIREINLRIAQEMNLADTPSL
jgi:MoaA/NifB/PqqE/SkfB family radical SAM enzyme